MNCKRGLQSILLRKPLFLFQILYLEKLCIKHYLDEYLFITLIYSFAPAKITLDVSRYFIFE